MDVSGGDDAAVAAIRSSLAAAAARLGDAGARDEALAEYRPARRHLLVARKPIMIPVARVWRLGALLLEADGTAWETGSTTRALPPGRPAFQSESAEQRRAYRDAAFRGRFAEGETVNFHARRIALAVTALRAGESVVFLDGDRALVRWNPAAHDGAAVALGDYLADRVDLLIHPPDGA